MDSKYFKWGTFSKLTYTDSFDSYANAADLDGSGDWLVSDGAFVTYKPAADGFVKCNAFADYANLAYYNKATITSDQYAQIVTNTLATGSFIGAAVRVTAGGNGYYYIVDDTGRKLMKDVAGTPTEIATSTDDCADGIIIKITAIGTTLRCYYDGSLDTSLTGGTGIFAGQADHSTGYVGIGGYNNYHSYGNDFEGGDL